MLPRGFSLPAAAALLLALLAPALGGGTSPLAEGVLMAGIAVVALVFPATAVRRGFWIGAGIVLMVALGWAWPAKWNHLPWRAMLEAAEIPVRACTSPDPGSSMRAWVLLLGGLAWAGWCAGIAWTNRSRRMVCEGLAAGIGLIALVAVAARHGHVPGWPAGTGLGPFANRNETTDIFAVGAFLTMACGVWRFGRISGSGAKMAFGLAWLCVLAIYMAALAMGLRGGAGAGATGEWAGHWRSGRTVARDGFFAHGAERDRSAGRNADRRFSTQDIQRRPPYDRGLAVDGHRARDFCGDFSALSQCLDPAGERAAP
jgi:hypothetical protein